MSNENKFNEVIDEVKAKIETALANLEHRIKLALHPSSHDNVTAQVAATKESLLADLNLTQDAANGVDPAVIPVVTNGAAGSDAGASASSDTAVLGDAGAASGSAAAGNAAGSDAASGDNAGTAAGTDATKAADGSESGADRA